MQEGKSFKRGEKHTSTESKLKKSFWQTPLPMWLQNFNTLFAIVMTLITGWLAVMTFITQAEIKGMKEVLATFKPTIRWVPSTMTLTADTILIQGHNRNYGTRSGTDIISYTYFITESAMYEKPNDTLNDMLPEEKYHWSFKFHRNFIPDTEVLNFTLATKLVFTDPITEGRDSSYTFSTNHTKENKVLSFYIASKAEEGKARERIKSMNDNF